MCTTTYVNALVINTTLFDAFKETENLAQLKKVPASVIWNACGDCPTEH